MIISDEVYLTLLPDIYSFRHIHAGIEEIMADHVHQGMTRNWISILLFSFFFIVMKDVFPFPSRFADDDEGAPASEPQHEPSSEPEPSSPQPLFPDDLFDEKVRIVGLGPIDDESGSEDSSGSDEDK